MKRIIIILAILSLALGGMHPRPARAAAALELYGTLEAMGVIVTIDPVDDPDGDMTTTLKYRMSGGGAYILGFPLSRLDNTRFVGSLFWLEAGTNYDVRVNFEDPDGGPLDGTSLDANAFYPLRGHHSNAHSYLLCQPNRHGDRLFTGSSLHTRRSCQPGRGWRGRVSA